MRGILPQEICLKKRTPPPNIEIRKGNDGASSESAREGRYRESAQTEVAEEEEEEEESG